MEQLDVSSFCKTKTQARDFTRGLATVSERIYETEFNLEKTLQEVFGMKKKDLLLALLHKQNINTDSAPILKAFLLKLQETITALPVITLTLAFDPQDKTLQVLSDWFAMNLKRQVLFDIATDPNLIAGAKINYNGTFADYSIKPLFDKMLTEYLNEKVKTVPTPQTNQSGPPPPIDDNFSLGR